MLRFDRIRAHNVGPFRDVDVNLAALPAIIAVVGPNGAGKSTLLELLGGALMRECPTRGALAGLARDRDSWVEVDVVNGSPWRVRQSMDATSGKGEALVLDGAGAAVLASTKVREFDAWAAAHFPAPSVLYSSTFGVQGSAGFLELKPSDRKAVLLRVLGVERLERMAEKARENLRGARERHAVATARVEAIIGMSASDAEKAWLDAVDAEVTAIDGARRARLVLENVRAEARRGAEAARELRARADHRASLHARIDVLDRSIREADARIANNRGLVEKRDEIEAAAARVTELRDQRGRVDVELVAAAVDERRLDEAIAGACADRLGELDSRAQRATEAERRARPLVERREAVNAAVEDLPRLRAGHERAHAAVAEAQAALDATMGLAVAGAEQRVGSLRGGLTRIASGERHAVTIATDVLYADGQEAELAEQLPARRRREQAALEVARSLAREAEKALRAAEREAAAADEVAAAEASLVAARAEQVAVAEARARLAAETASTRAERDQVRASIREHRTIVADLAAELGRLEPLAARADKLAAASARIEELSASILAAHGERQQVERQLADLGTDDGAPPAVDVTPAERDVRVADEALQRATSQRAVAQREHEVAKERDAKRAEHEATRDAVAVEIGDWKRLADDLGRDGIQALEIDAAGPELSALANDLLHTCVGPRWTVTIDTQRTSSDGRLLESLDVRVLDTVAGRDANVETYSGGERVLLGEAVSLALAMLACRRSGQRDVTIVRDESGAALDGERGRAYVAMLRRALTLTGARQVLLVSHSEDVAALCDARLHVENGTVTVRA